MSAGVLPGSPRRIGPFRVESRLGQGGMGVVYVARHEGTGARVALKTVGHARALPLGSLRREIRALSRVAHPGLVRILDEGVHEGVPWYAMELLEGESLRRLVSPDGTGPHGGAGTASATPPVSGDAPTVPLAHDDRSHGGFTPARPAEGTRRARLIEIVRRLCDPLSHLHAEGIVHRDLKPENVLVLPGDRPVLLDLGLMGTFAADLGREAMDVGGDMVGTVWYMAPEQVRGELPDARADLYALGCILYEILTGRPPFLGATVMEVLTRQLQAAPAVPSELAPDVPAELESIVLRLLAKAPADRIGYAVDLSAALEPFGEPDRSAQPAPHLPPARPYLYRPRLSGRADVLARLRTVFPEIARRRGALLAMGGESGVGKTRLAMELATQARELSLLVIGGEGGGPSSGAPLQPLRGLLQAVADRCRERGPRETAALVRTGARLLVPYEPALLGLPGIEALAEPEPLPPEAARLRILSALADTLLALAEREPLFMILDDVHEADDLTLGFLDLLARTRALEQVPAVLVAVYRSDAVSEAMTFLAHVAPERHSSLSRLGPPDVASIVSDMLALPAPPEPMVAFLGQVSEGNPLFLAEYLRTLVAEGVLSRDAAGRWRVAGSGPNVDLLEATLPMPGSLRSLLERRLQSLPDWCVPVLDAAAVLGHGIDEEILSRMAEGHDVPAAARHLVARAVLEDAGDALRFTHGRLRDAAHDRVGEAERRRLHAAAASALRERPEEGELAAEIAHHLEGAGDGASARPFYLAAARRAAARFAHRDAERHYRRFLALSPETSAERLAARVELGDGVLRIAGRSREAIAEIEVALVEARSAADATAEARCLRSLGYLYRIVGRVDDGRDAFEGAIALAVRKKDDGLRAVLMSEQTVLEHLVGRVDLAERICREALGFLEKGTDRVAEGMALTYLGTLLLEMGRLPEAEPVHRRAVSLLRQSGDRHSLAVALGNLANYLKDTGEQEKAREALLEVKRIADETGDLRYLGVAIVSLASLAYDEQRFDEALRLYMEGLDVLRRVGDRRSEGVVLANIGQMHLLQGAFSGARPFVDEALLIHREVGNRRSEAASLRVLGDLLYADGDVAAARGLYLQSLSIARDVKHHRLGMLALLALCHLEREGAGNIDAADAYAAEASAGIWPQEHPSDLVDLACQEGCNALARGRDGRPHLARAREIAGRATHPIDPLSLEHVALLERSIAAAEAGRPLVHGQADRPPVLDRPVPLRP